MTGGSHEVSNPIPRRQAKLTRSLNDFDRFARLSVVGDAMSEPNMSDTLIACCGSLGYFLPYMRGEYAPHYPLPAIDYYNSANPNHVAIGNLMEWYIPIETQLRFRG